MSPSSEMEALRAYVMGPSSQNQSDSVVRLRVTHSNLKANFVELRMDYHMSIESVKVKLSFHCGTSPGAMRLQLRTASGTYELDDDRRLLGYYSPKDDDTLHVIDTDPSSLSAGGWLEDTSKVDKYVMSEEAYASRENTYRKFKESKLAADPSWTLKRELAERASRRGAGQQETGAEGAARLPLHGDGDASHVSAGSRCRVEGDRRGVVRFVGPCEGLPAGTWVGVEYDEPVGKGDGSVKGVSYFECRDKYGGFVRPGMVTCGEFPPVDDFAFSDQDEL